MYKATFNNINTPEIWESGTIQKNNFYLNPRQLPTNDIELKEYAPFNKEIIVTTLGAVVAWFIILNIYFNSKDSASLIFSVIPIAFSTIAFFDLKRLLVPKKIHFKLCNYKNQEKT